MLAMRTLGRVFVRICPYMSHNASAKADGMYPVPPLVSSKPYNVGAARIGYFQARGVIGPNEIRFTTWVL